MKDRGCANRVSNMEETKEQARESFDEIDVLMLKRVWADMREYVSLNIRRTQTSLFKN